MVRPILEYASIIWSTHTQCDIHKIVMVQHCAVRFTFNNFSRTASFINMLANLQLPTLECQRHKVESFILTKSTTKTRGHSFRLTQPLARTEMYFIPFIPRQLDHGTTSPVTLLSVPRLNILKTTQAMYI